jgi:hypothetical protein
MLFCLHRLLLTPRWAHSVADIKTMLAFSSTHQQQQQQQQPGGSRDAASRQQSSKQQRSQRQASPSKTQSAAGAAAGSGPPAALASFNGSISMLQVSDAGGSSDPGSITFASMHRSASGGMDSDASGGMYSPNIGPDSPRSTTSPSLTPSRLLSPSVSRNARASAQLPVLDTLHEESHTHSRSHSNEDRSSWAGSSRRNFVSLAAAAAALAPGSLTRAAAAAAAAAEDTPGSSGISPRHAGFAPVSPRLETDRVDTPGDVRMSRGSDLTNPASVGYSPSPSPNAFLNHLLRSARGSQHQQESPSAGADVVPAATAALPGSGLQGSPLQQQGSGGSHLPPVPASQQQQQPPSLQDDQRQRSQRESMARQVASLVSNRWLARRGSQERPDRSSSMAAAGVQETRSAPVPILTSNPAAGGDEEGSSDDTSPGAVATVTAAEAAAESYAFTVTVSSAEHGYSSGSVQQQYSGDSSSAPPSKQSSARAFIMRLASSISRMSSRGATAESAPDPAAIRAAANGAGLGLDARQIQSAFSAASGNSKFDVLAASKRRLLASWVSWR